MKSSAGVRALGAIAVVVAALVLGAPAHGAILVDYVDAANGKCTGVAMRDSKFAQTSKTSFATCSSHSVRAKIQPPSSGGASWSSWVAHRTAAKVSTSYAIVDSGHRVYS